MIHKIILNNFKVHNHLELDLGGLTILTGENGMGKSSVIQSLLLLRQSCDRMQTPEGLDLQGELCKLGSTSDILCQSTNSDTLDINLETTNGNLNFSFDCNAQDTINNVYDTFIPTKECSQPTNAQIAKCSLFTDDFQYASAFRLGPQDLYGRDTRIVQRHKQISKTNGQCEFVVHFLEHWGNKIKCLDRLCQMEEGETIDEVNELSEQVHRWLQFISPRINVKIDPLGKAFKLNYNFKRNDGSTDNMSAINVGYGVTYTLPIIVAILSAKPGALILIENPEAHIHPGAQSALMDLITRAVKAGIQIVIETHSDHIINGMLVKVAQENRDLKKGVPINGPSTKYLSKVYFFERNNENHTSEVIPLQIVKDGHIVTSVEIDEDGDENIILAPEGFFDQIQKDVKIIWGCKK